MSGIYMCILCLILAFFNVTLFGMDYLPTNYIATIDRDNCQQNNGELSSEVDEDYPAEPEQSETPLNLFSPPTNNFLSFCSNGTERAHEFVDGSIHYGETIILEVHKRHFQKTIKISNNIGGFAGGDKFLVGDILFKLAVDRKLGEGMYLYGGNEPSIYYANKVANQELLAANKISSFWPSVSVPLMALIDFNGHRIVAVQYINLAEDSLAYGSEDGGRTFYSNEDEVAEIMNKLGRELNLKKHLTCTNQSTRLPIDLEAHWLDTQHLVVLDSPRSFPPEFKKGKNSNIHAIRLRPEFVKKYTEATNPDVGTGFNLNPEHETAVSNATNHLYEVVIPSFADKLRAMTREEDNAVLKNIIDYTSKFYTLQPHQNHMIPDPLIVLLHQNGLNIRHLGCVYNELINRQTSIDIMNDDYRKLVKYIVSVMVVRSLKNETREQIGPMKSKNAIYECLASKMNLLTPNSLERSVDLDGKLTVIIQKYFNVLVNDLRTQLHEGFALLYFCNLMGVELSPRCSKSFEELYDTNPSYLFFKFSANDFALKPTIKYSNVLNLYLGLEAYQKSLAEHDQRIKMDYAVKAHNCLFAARATWSNMEHDLIQAMFANQSLDEIISSLALSIAAYKETLKNSRAQDLVGTGTSWLLK